MNSIPPIQPAPVHSFFSNPRVRVGSALVGLAGVLTLAGCSGASNATSSASPSASSASTYKNGTYTGQGSYSTPGSVEKVSVSVTLKDDVVTAVQVTADPQVPESKKFQTQFTDGVAAVVVGKNIDTLSVSRIAGSSLTSGGFNKAIDQIKSEAKA